MDKIETLLDRFDFDKAQAYMTLVNWTVAGEVPSINELRREAKRISELAWDRYLSTAKQFSVPVMSIDYGLVSWVNEDDKVVLMFYIEKKQDISKNENP